MVKSDSKPCVVVVRSDSKPWVVVVRSDSRLYVVLCMHRSLSSSVALLSSSVALRLHTQWVAHGIVAILDSRAIMPGDDG